MRSLLIFACSLASVLALPVTQVAPSCPAKQPIDILEYSEYQAWYTETPLTVSQIKTHRFSSFTFLTQ